MRINHFNFRKTQIENESLRFFLKSEFSVD